MHNLNLIADPLVRKTEKGIYCFACGEEGHTRRGCKKNQELMFDEDQLVNSFFISEED